MEQGLDKENAPLLTSDHLSLYLCLLFGQVMSLWWSVSANKAQLASTGCSLSNKLTISPFILTTTINIFYQFINILQAFLSAEDWEISQKSQGLRGMYFPFSHNYQGKIDLKALSIQIGLQGCIFWYIPRDGLMMREWPYTGSSRDVECIRLYITMYVPSGLVISLGPLARCPLASGNLLVFRDVLYTRTVYRYNMVHVE